MTINILNQLNNNQQNGHPWHLAFIIGYAILFLIVLSCNLIAMLAGYRRYKKCRSDQGQRNRTELTRCILVIYLSALGILLCLTIPLIAVDLLTIDVLYANPNIDWMCRYTKFIPAMVIYATSMLVILIAVDSYRNVCKPLKSQLTPYSSTRIFIIIIIVAIFLASPLFYASQMLFVPVDHSNALGIEDRIDSSFGVNQSIDDHPKYPLDPAHSSDYSNSDFELHNESNRNERQFRQMPKGRNESMVHLATEISVCVENWHLIPGSFKSGRMYYSIFSLIAQYLLPFITISILHAMVFSELKTLGERRSQIIIQIENAENSHTETARMKRNTAVLTTMSLVFCFCWLPQNLIYVALDGYHDLFGYDPDTTVKISVICHWIGMASTWINPILYGFLNTQIRQGRTRK